MVVAGVQQYGMKISSNLGSELDVLIGVWPEVEGGRSVSKWCLVETSTVEIEFLEVLGWEEWLKNGFDTHFILLFLFVPPVYWRLDSSTTLIWVNLLSLPSTFSSSERHKRHSEVMGSQHSYSQDVRTLSNGRISGSTREKVDIPGLVSSWPLHDPSRPLVGTYHRLSVPDPLPIDTHGYPDRVRNLILVTVPSSDPTSSLYLPRPSVTLKYFVTLTHSQ